MAIKTPIFEDSTGNSHLHTLWIDNFRFISFGAEQRKSDVIGILNLYQINPISSKGSFQCVFRHSIHKLPSSSLRLHRLLSPYDKGGTGRKECIFLMTTIHSVSYITISWNSIHDRSPLPSKHSLKSLESIDYKISVQTVPLVSSTLQIKASVVLKVDEHGTFMLLGLPSSLRVVFLPWDDSRVVIEDIKVDLKIGESISDIFCSKAIINDSILFSILISSPAPNNHIFIGGCRFAKEMPYKTGLMSISAINKIECDVCSIPIPFPTKLMFWNNSLTKKLFYLTIIGSSGELLCLGISNSVGDKAVCPKSDVCRFNIVQRCFIEKFVASTPYATHSIPNSGNACIFGNGVIQFINVIKKIHKGRILAKNMATPKKYSFVSSLDTSPDGKCVCFSDVSGICGVFELL
ncbi:hypothetical protein ADUPG1_006597 [Aduncisulcus paluster]|uniref:Uncharacterized protein n=1 Tax=Aduncisulcus paluster TaxID=2918883 RepID=A0ABQ5KIT6_9EUKA|nr:hypothetical protein ADUPG1_006597 [Aduncisulcus paluster]